MVAGVHWLLTLQLVEASHRPGGGSEGARAEPTARAGARAPATASAFRSGFRWVVLGLATLMQVGVSLPQQTPAAIGPALTQALGLHRAELGLLTSAIWGGMLIGMLPFGMLVDRFGERSTLLVGGVLAAGFLLLASRAPSFQPLFLALVPAAIGGAASSPGGTRALAAWFEPHRRGTAMGIRQTGVTAAGVLAAIILPPIAQSLGWHAAFVTAALLSLAGVTACAVCYREPPSAERGPASRLHPRVLFRSRTWLVATAFGWMFMGALGCAVAYLAVSLHDDAGLSPVQAGLLLAVLQVGGIAGRLGWGMLSDRIGSRGRTMAMAAAVAVLATLGMAVLGHRAVAVPALVAIVFLLGLSCMGWNALYITLSAEVVPVRNAATAVGAGSTITFTGMFALPPLFGVIADHTGTYSWSWLALAGWAAAGTVVAVAIRDRARAGADLSRPGTDPA